ncbi:MAG: Ig-like domain-containing protein, partial [Candidatus Heimdallarchaeota archaeon]
MPINPHFHISRLKKSSIKLFLIVLLTASLFIAIYDFNYTPIRGHSPLAYPKEIYSLYNSTILPNIDGKIEFNGTDASAEWASAAIYDLYDNLESARGKVFLQNDDSYLYIGFDMIDYEVEDPATIWGAGIFFDLNHNGILDLNDGCISILTETNETVHVDVYQGLDDGSWNLLTTGTPGDEIPTLNVTVDMDYSTTYFDQTNSHRQYEFRIDLDTIDKSPGDLFGIGFAATDDYSSSTAGISWPYTDDTSIKFRDEANFWGDIYLGEDGTYTKYVIEDNFNIKDSAIGANNGTFLTKGDIDGDNELELIVSSNRTVAGDSSLIAIYDIVGGEVTQIWQSWTSTEYTCTFAVQDMQCYDFDGNGEDEIYFVGDQDSRVMRLRNWDDIGGDFDELETVFENYDNTMGYLAIGDATNDNDVDILIGDSVGVFGILEYKNMASQFELWNDAWYGAPDINGSEITRIHAIGIAETDHDIYDSNEILMLSQFSSDDSISSTGLQIFEIWGTSIYDNPTADETYGYEDDLPLNSHSNTFDSFGHTVIVDDVDNDGIHETIIIGKDYLKIFGHDTFNDTDIPLVLDINDESYPSMGGGAGIVDIDGDSYNELVVGCNNGTTFVYQIIDLNPDDAIEDLLAITEWKGDLGTMPGKRGSIIGFDIDDDGVDEAIIGDQFGQIIVLGLGELPTFTITSPSEGYTTNQDTILFEWETSNDSLPIVFYDIYINAVLSLRVGGAQTGAVIPLDFGSNSINIVCTDIRGETDSDSRLVTFDAGAPTIDITGPEDGYLTDQPSITVYWDAEDPQSDDLTFEIYANGTLKGTTTSLQQTFSFDSKGTWNITVIADDGTGDRVRDMIYVTYDNSGPVITITSPADNSYVSTSTIQLVWSAYDEYSSIDYYEIYRDGALQGNTTSKFYDVELTVDKEYTLEVIAYDILGNFDSDSIHITRDTLNPSVSLEPLSYPENYDDWYITDLADLFVEWNGTDTASGSGINYFEILINDELYSNYTSTAESDTITLIEGANDVEIIAYDMAGNFASDYYMVAYDVSNPQVTIIAPQDNYLTSAENVTIFWDASDVGSGIKEISVIVDSVIVATFTDSTVNSYLVNISETKIYTITVRVTDFLDNLVEDTIHVEHDPVQPTLIITNPLAEASYINSTFVEVIWETINIDADEFIVFINGTDYTYSNTTFDAIINLEDVFGTIDENMYPLTNITVVAVVGGEYLYPDTKYVTVDLKDPLVAIISPLNFATISDDSVLITWSGSDVGSDISSYTLWINGSYIGTWDKTVTSRDIDVEGYSNGVYMIVLQGRDFAGNVKNSTIYINLFPSDPEFTLDIPTTVITNDPNFPVTISIIDPSS